MNLTEAMEYLLSNQYVLSAGKGKYSFSKKFEQEYVPRSLKQKTTTDVLAINPQMPIAVKPVPKNSDNIYYAHRFITFITEANVPKRIEGGRGKWYPGNKYNEEAAIKFHKMIHDEGINYDILVRSTALYYASSIDFKKVIGNYILQGDWRTDYEELKNRAGEGKEELEKHIKNELKNDGEQTYYRRG